MYLSKCFPCSQPQCFDRRRGLCVLLERLTCSGVCSYLPGRWWWRRVECQCRTTDRWLQTRTESGSHCLESLHTVEQSGNVRVTEYYSILHTHKHKCSGQNLLSYIHKDRNTHLLLVHSELVATCLWFTAWFLILLFRKHRRILGKGPRI